MNKYTMQLLSIMLLTTVVGTVWGEAMIFKCKNAQGATIYKKTACDEDSDTVSTFTPKEPKMSAPTESAEDKKGDKKEAVVLTLKQNPSGHYLTEGNVDGKPLIFVVDTGASLISLPEKDAHDAQIYCDKNINIATANGNSSSCTAKAKKVQFGPFIVQEVEIVIVPNLSQPLLGMNVLQLFKISQEKGEMKISTRDKGNAENPSK